MYGYSEGIAAFDGQPSIVSLISQNKIGRSVPVAGQAVASAAVDDLGPGMEQSALVLQGSQGLSVTHQHHPATKTPNVSQGPRRAVRFPLVSRSAAVDPHQWYAILIPLQNVQDIVLPETQETGLRLNC
jgi:hypothetical protein